MGEKIKQIKTNLKSKSQLHDSKHAELRRLEDEKIPEIEGDVGKLPKTHYICSITTAVYTYDGEEISGMPELHKAFITYKRVTKGNLFYIKFYTAPAEILYEEIKPPIQVVKIDQLMIYSNSRELRKADMDEVLQVNMNKYPDHICSKCNDEDNIIPDVHWNDQQEDAKKEKIETRR
ncbi:hypothetical protein H5410_060069 [Solanum commersonii]|uniref:Uncharacterized protein n=1 Tax=Solanum commersonii TaxID=4109 RepID=A0A9J5W4J0_SOLCO|nr:hypothetical protein H5410_060069 [Solanum commersonii]